MLKNKIAFALLSISILLAACGPSQADHDAAVATQVALLMQEQGTSGGATVAPANEVPTSSAGTQPTTDAEIVLPGDAACTPDETPRVIGTAVEVWSGDSIGVDINGTIFEVRYIGIDGDDNEAALDANRQLVEGKQVLLIMDTTDADEFGRLLRYVIADGVFINMELLRRGVAYAAAEEPDLSCQDEFSRVRP
jgi:endonuclease YncB( thermonuclease family)